MTKIISGSELASSLEQSLPGSVTDSNEVDVWVSPASLFEVCEALKNPKGLDFSYLTSISAVDYIDSFELVYHVLSMRNNYSGVIKCRCSSDGNGRGEPTVPSVTGIWKGADLQEREIWDLMGIKFDGHPNLKRILLWEGFDGHPLRKDYLG